MVKAVLAYIYQKTEDDKTCEGWHEVNGIKYLFHPTQPWTREQLNAFALSAFAYIEAQ